MSSRRARGASKSQSEVEYAGQRSIRIHCARSQHDSVSVCVSVCARARMHHQYLRSVDKTDLGPAVKICLLGRPYDREGSCKP